MWPDRNRMNVTECPHIKAPWWAHLNVDLQIGESFTIPKVDQDWIYDRFPGPHDLGPVVNEAGCGNQTADQLHLACTALLLSKKNYPVINILSCIISSFRPELPPVQIKTLVSFLPSVGEQNSSKVVGLPLFMLELLTRVYIDWYGCLVACTALCFKCPVVDSFFWPNGVFIPNQKSLVLSIFHNELESLIGDLTFRPRRLISLTVISLCACNRIHCLNGSLLIVILLIRWL